MAGVKKSISLLERLIARSEKSGSGCIEWSGYCMNGYGKIRANGKRVFVHRLAYEISHGQIPDGACVCHRCDNTRCLNVEHLFLGTRADNNADKTFKGRQSRGPNHGLKGELHPLSVLTKEQVKSIRESHGIGIRQKDLAIAYEVSQSCISTIVNNKRWKSI